MHTFHKRSSRSRREQHLLAEARTASRLVAGVTLLSTQRGSQPSIIGTALLNALNCRQLQQQQQQQQQQLSICRHFLRGICTWGSSCRFAHASPCSKASHNADVPELKPQNQHVFTLSDAPYLATDTSLAITQSLNPDACVFIPTSAWSLPSQLPRSQSSQLPPTSSSWQPLCLQVPDVHTAASLAPVSLVVPVQTVTRAPFFPGPFDADSPPIVQPQSSQPASCGEGTFAHHGPPRPSAFQSLRQSSMFLCQMSQLLFHQPTPIVFQALVTLCQTIGQFPMPRQWTPFQLLQRTLASMARPPSPL